MPTKKEKVTFICDLETKNELEYWAKEEGQTISSLVGRIVGEAIATRQGKKPIKKEAEPEPANIHELVQRNLNKLRRHTGIKNLKQIANAEVLPTKDNFLLIMQALAVPENLQQKLWFATYGNNSNHEEGIENGTT
ncbi:hypothetical protein SAMD00079811_50240 [Scytonema sp. HK-05]|uniref:hypothetical protein n=1 Tax=Scytonema sp. HK-05 TaxID=1137095 RepID=UPI000936CFB5|nr:hypothetical protein [Scytonema sp. HK-05]OKH58030.1 hypothetical protein NIES2130_16965 [Scytonema sp. HK-05]BAY47406.1 hypothetical protein SAMD00079811_50240 [Scytonema sp. HK-05]